MNSGFIDITCEDANGIVVVELKVGTADSRAIGQILGYMGDLQEEEGGKPEHPMWCGAFKNAHQY